VNIQEYISSGIVESYVLGLADQQDRAEFERMCSAHAEVRRARELFELALEEQALSNAVTPSKNIRSKIFSEIEIETEKMNENLPDDDSGKVHYVPADRDTAPPAKVSLLGWQRYLAAASIALLIVSTALNFILFSQYKTYSNRYSLLLAQQAELAKNNDVMRAKVDTYESTLSMLRNSDMTVVKMPGTNVPSSPDSNSVATVYWDNKSKDVYLMVNNLPPPPSDKQYQLWAIVDGQPIDAGVFDLQNTLGFVRMKNMPRAQIFAVTLEKRGGSTTPQGPMYVLGKVS
jgi:anti-sigma-K factor RskA